MKVLVAMSGGVDSSVVAAQMVEAGHEVMGAHLRLEKDEVSLAGAANRGCSTPQDAQDAADIAKMLGIDFQIWDLKESFRAIVMNDFLDQYRRGLTPNPCVRCNQHVKFAELTRRAWEAGFDAVATGHYAKIIGSGANAQLHRAANPKKDQSYVLSVVGRENLGRLLFPLGDFTSKDEVRAAAASYGLPVSSKAESFDICFIPDGDTQGFLSRNLGANKGEVVDESGEVVGSHAGYYNFTIGQRKGIGTPGPAKDGLPRYVKSIEVDTNRVVIATRERLAVQVLQAGPAVWLTDETEVLDDVQVQFRAHGKPIDAVVYHDMNTGSLRAELSQEVFGVAPGQSLVIYRGTQVLGSGAITSAKNTADE